MMELSGKELPSLDIWIMVYELQDAVYG